MCGLAIKSTLPKNILIIAKSLIHPLWQPSVSNICVFVWDGVHAIPWVIAVIYSLHFCVLDDTARLFKSTGRDNMRGKSRRYRSRKRVLYIISTEHISSSLNPSQILPFGANPSVCLAARSSASCCPEVEGHSSAIQHTPVTAMCSADNLFHAGWVNRGILLLCYSFSSLI